LFYDQRLAVLLYGISEGFYDKAVMHGVGKGVTDYNAGGPIDNNHQIHPAPAHANVGQVNAPDMVRVFWLYVPEQIRISPSRIVLVSRAFASTYSLILY
jgi:hypothetical protein